jgi:hypothetical protein
MREDELLKILNEESRIAKSPKWVVHSPSHCFISESKDDLEEIMHHYSPYEYRNATYHFPAKPEDYYTFWRKNIDHLLKKESLFWRLWWAIF